MDKIFIGYESAIEFYRNARVNLNLDIGGKYPEINSLILTPTVTQPTSLNCDCSNIMQTPNLPFCGEGLLHLCFSGNKIEYRNPFVIKHSLNVKYPSGSFLKYSNDIFIAGPELVFYQLSQFMSFYDLVQIGLEFCGSYCVDENNMDGFVFNLDSITNQAKLVNYLKKLKLAFLKAPHINQAIDVANLIIDGSASPYESLLYIKLCAPRKYGGYGLKGFKANEKIKLSSKASEIFGNNYIKPDLSNRKTKIAIEYDSNAFHNNTNQNELDKIRIDALHHDG